MTNIAIIGLGLMGASFAKKLTHLNYNVYGIDVSTRVSTLARSCSTTELRQHLFSALKSYHLMQNYSRTSLKILKESYHK